MHVCISKGECIRTAVRSWFINLPEIISLEENNHHLSSSVIHSSVHTVHTRCCYRSVPSVYTVQSLHTRCCYLSVSGVEFLDLFPELAVNTLHQLGRAPLCHQ